MNARVDQKERTHSSILESAARLLRTKGISGARVADVMKGAGLTVGGFYAHFESKEELVDDALRRLGAELREKLFVRLDEKPADARGEVVVKRYLSPAHRSLKTLGCPFPAIVGEIGTTAPEHRQVLAEEIDQLAEKFARISGKSRNVALGIVALMVGGLSLARALDGTELSDEVLRACRALAASVLKEK